MKVYVSHESNGDYRITLHDYPRANVSVKELEVPESAGRLLLAAQATSDALQDSLRKMFSQESSAHLDWNSDREPNR
jgi:hypothetical protein